MLSSRDGSKSTALESVLETADPTQAAKGLQNGPSCKLKTRVSILTACMLGTHKRKDQLHCIHPANIYMNEMCNADVCTVAQAPTHAGHPPMHKYRLERQNISARSHVQAQAVWDVAADEVDARDLSFIDTNLKVMQF